MRKCGRNVDDENPDSSINTRNQTYCVETIRDRRARRGSLEKFLVSMSFMFRSMICYFELFLISKIIEGWLDMLGFGERKDGSEDP